MRWGAGIVLYCSVLFYGVGTLCKPCWYWVWGFYLYNVLLFYTITKAYEVNDFGKPLHFAKGVSRRAKNIWRL